MRTLFVLTLLLLPLSILWAQNSSIIGKVVDKETGEGIISATVYLQNKQSAGAITNLDGNFVLDNVPAGEQTLLINYVGYQELQQSVQVKAGETLILDKLLLTSSSIGLNEVKVVASVAIDRKTPVAVSTITAEEIENKLGNQEFPEILKSTPSIYTTKSGGGFGDARINVRGFDQRNTAVMINGIPVNDMENGWVYWSNWAGLSDVTRSMQVQRGLGASKLAISSVGGTINIITKTTDQQRGGAATISYGNNNYLKASLLLSTGRLAGGWAITAQGAYTRGDGYIDATRFQGGSYFLSIAKEMGENHQLVLTAIGAAQRHGQRTYREKISFYDSIVGNPRFNSDYGFKNGEEFNIRENFYHKPQIALNHYWTISDRTFLSTSAYVSFGRGGGTGDRGGINGKATWGYKDSLNNVRVDDIIAWNSGTNNIDGFPETGNLYHPQAGGYVAGERNGLIKRASMNSHNWYGVLSTVNHDFSNQLKLSGGIDLRYYRGIHYRKVYDLMGNDAWLDTRDVNNQGYDLDLDGNGSIDSKESGALKKEGDKIHYHNDGLVGWAGTFAQLEYSSDFGLDVFVSGAISNTSYQRVDYFQYTPGNQRSEQLNYLGYTAKVGANYNINRLHNVFFNSGYFSRAPMFDDVFPYYNNEANPEAKNEKVLGLELGYGFRHQYLAANLNLYYTQWRDKSINGRYTDSEGNDFSANILGLNAVHQGVELDLKSKPYKGLSLRAMLSLGDWRWTNNVNAIVADDNDSIVGNVDIYAQDLKVGDAAQTTFGAGVAYQFKFGLSLDADYIHYRNLYANFDPADRSTTQDQGRQALKLPAYGLLDAGISYTLKVKDLKLRWRFNMNNVLNTQYIAETNDYFNSNQSYEERLQNARGFYGFGRTWNLSMKVIF